MDLTMTGLNRTVVEDHASIAPGISVVVPVYNSEPILPDLVARLAVVAWGKSLLGLSLF